MFINCPNCSALVATDLASDLPPERCPRCNFGMRDDKPGATPAAGAAAPAPTPPPAMQPAPAAPRPLVFVPLTPSRPAATPPPASGTSTRLDEPPAAEEAVHDAAREAAPGSTPAAEPDAGPGDAPATPEVALPPAVSAGAAPLAAQPDAPGFLRRRRGVPGPGPGRRSIALAGGLAMLLVVQLLLADRDRLAASAGWRPAVAVLCGALRCSLPPWREPAAIAVEQRDVRPLPDRPGVLRVSATIRNDARWAQAWPRLTLTLSDVDGRALGMGTFEPAQYLTAPPQDVTVASGESAAIQMDIVEPSPHAVAFNFRFD